MHQMDRQTHRPKISAIIPAYNEAERLGPVLSVLMRYPDFSEVIVVDDGSKDETAAIAERLGAKVLRNEKNRGKGFSVDRGIREATGDIIFCSDADVSGLTEEMVDEIIGPVAREEADMFIGMCDRPIYALRPIFLFTPLLGGERAFRRSLWDAIPDDLKSRFRMETALNFYTIHGGGRLRYKSFRGLTQTVKEQKYGFWDGLGARLRMIGNIISANVELHIASEGTISRFPERARRSFAVRRANVPPREVKDF